MHSSGRVSRIAVSSTAAVLAKADKLKATGVDVVDFGPGEPDFPTPENIKKAALQALQDDFTKYTPTGGIPELREALVMRHARDFGSRYEVEECLVTPGGKHAIFQAMGATINSGDEVILPVPYWVSFLDIINYCGGKAVLLETREDDTFAVRAKAVEKLITPKTKLIIINSPNNPSGAVTPFREMEQLLDVAADRDILLMSDECYCHFLYDGNKPFSLGQSKNRENLILIGSLSKTYAMTGWRVGFALGGAKLIANMMKIQSHSTSNPNSIAQKAAIEAVTGPQDSIQIMLTEYNHRRNLVVERLRSIPGVQCTMPQGAFYAYPNFANYLGSNGASDTTNLAERILDEAQVAVVPGPAFGTRRQVRISYATSRERIDQGLRRLAAFCHKIRTE